MGISYTPIFLSESVYIEIIIYNLYYKSFCTDKYKLLKYV